MTMTMEFQFVVHSDAQQPGTRKAIRSHVMKGKNAGRKLPLRQQQQKVNKKNKNKTTATATGDDSDDTTLHASGNTRHDTNSSPWTTHVKEGQQRRRRTRIASAGAPARVPRVVGHELSWRPFPDGFSSESVDLFRYCELPFLFFVSFDPLAPSSIQSYHNDTRPVRADINRSPSLNTCPALFVHE